MDDKYQLQRRELIYTPGERLNGDEGRKEGKKEKNTELERTAFCLLREGKIVLVMWDATEPSRMDNIIAQIEAVKR